MPGTTRYSASLDQPYTESGSPPPNGVGPAFSCPSSQGDSSVSSGMGQRSNSTDSLGDRSTSSGGHSRQVSQDGIEVIPTRTTKATVPKPVYNPMQFVKTGPCHLSKTAVQQLKKAEELKKLRKETREKEEDWQLNLDSWKSSRRKKQEFALERMKEIKVLEEEQHERTRRKNKTFNEMMQERRTSRGRLPSLAIYTDDADQDLSDLGVGKSSSASSLNTESPGRSVSDSDRRTDSGTEMEDRLENEMEEKSYKEEKRKYATKGVNGFDDSGEEYTYEKAIQNYVNYAEAHVKGKLINNTSVTDKQNNGTSVDQNKNRNTVVDMTGMRKGSVIEEKLAMLNASKDLSPDRKISTTDNSNIDLVKRRSLFERSSSDEREVKQKHRRSADLSDGFKDRLASLKNIDTLEKNAQNMSVTDTSFREKLANFRNMELSSNESKSDFKQSERNSKHDQPYCSVEAVDSMNNGNMHASDKLSCHKNRYSSLEALDTDDSQSYASERNLTHKERGRKTKKIESFERTQSLGNLDRCGKYKKYGKTPSDDLSSSSMSPSSDDEVNMGNNRTFSPSDRINCYSKLKQQSASKLMKPTHSEPVLNMNGHIAQSQQKEMRSQPGKDKHFILQRAPSASHVETDRNSSLQRTPSTPYVTVNLAAAQVQEEMCVRAECPRPPSVSLEPMFVRLQEKAVKWYGNDKRRTVMEMFEKKEEIRDVAGVSLYSIFIDGQLETPITEAPLVGTNSPSSCQNVNYVEASSFSNPPETTAAEVSAAVSEGISTEFPNNLLETRAAKISGVSPETVTSRNLGNSLETLATERTISSPKTLAVLSSTRLCKTEAPQIPSTESEARSEQNLSCSPGIISVCSFANTAETAIVGSLSNFAESAAEQTDPYCVEDTTLSPTESLQLDTSVTKNEVKPLHDVDEFVKKPDLDIPAEAKMKSVVNISFEAPSEATILTPVSQEEKSPINQSALLFETEQLTALELTGDCAVLGEFDFPVGPPSSAEPPKEKPPPPPVLGVEEDHSTDDGVETQKGSKLKLVSQRIHKELWRRRSDFLGIENVSEKDYMDLASQVTPPPDIKTILEAERELDKKENQLHHFNERREKNTVLSETSADRLEASPAEKWEPIEEEPTMSTFEPVMFQELPNRTASLEEEEIERKEREIIENLEKEEQERYHRINRGIESESAGMEEEERIRRLEEDRRKMEAERERREEERIQMEEENAHREEQQRLHEKEQQLRMQETVVAKPVMVNESASDGLDSNLTHNQEEMLKLEKEKLMREHEELQRVKRDLKLQQQEQLQQAHLQQLPLQEQLQHREQQELQQLQEAHFSNMYPEVSLPESAPQLQHNIPTLPDHPGQEQTAAAIQQQYQQPPPQSSGLPASQQVYGPHISSQPALQPQPIPRPRKYPSSPPPLPVKPNKPPHLDMRQRNEMIRLSRNPSATPSPEDEPPALPPKQPLQATVSAPSPSKQWPPEIACGQQMSKNTLHALSAPPRSRLMNSESWIVKKKPESQPRENFNHHKHWLIQEAEHRRITEMQQRKAQQHSHPTQSQQVTAPSVNQIEQTQPAQPDWRASVSSGEQSPSPQVLWRNPEPSGRPPMTSQVPWRKMVGSIDKAVPPHLPWKKSSPTAEQPQPQWKPQVVSKKEKPLPDSIIQTLTQRVQNKTAPLPNYANVTSSQGGSPTSISSGGAALSSASRSESPRDYMDVSAFHHGKIPNLQTPSPRGGMPAPQVPTPVSREQREKMLSVSGKKKCSHCGDELGRGAAMIIESLRLFYHIDCFKCCVCHVQLGNGMMGTDVRVRNNKLHCHNCYSNDEGLKFSKV